MSLTLHEIIPVGENRHWTFIAARCGDRWLGGAVGKTEPPSAKLPPSADGLDPNMFFVFPEVSDELQLGVLDRDRAILLVGAIAQDIESTYGGITTWRVAPELQGRPDDFRCEVCDRVGCQGVECVGADIDLDMEGH